MAEASGAEAALGFVARREGRRSMPRTRWEQVLSLDLGWMAPAQARGYVERAQAAGWLVPEGAELRFVRDPQAVEVPRRFRPDPAAPIAPAPVGPGDGPDDSRGAAAGVPSAAATAAATASRAGAASAAEATATAAEPGAVPEERPADADTFLAWVQRVAAATKQGRDTVLAEVAARQERMGGLLTAEAAVLLLAHEAGLDVAAAAREALARLGGD